MKSITPTTDLDKLEKIVLSGLSEHRLQNGQTNSIEAEKFGFEIWHGDEIIGGITGKIRWSWMYIQYLWVSPEETGKGYGKNLVQKAEALAKEKNCVGIHVDTFTYQAPDFYKSLGFTEFGRLQNYPDTIERIYLQKCL